MTRPSFRLPLAEGLALLGVLFGAWLINNAFQPLADIPNPALVIVGGLDILLCFGLIGWLLRQRLSDGQPISRGWIAGGVVLLGCFLGWVAALFIDADRLRSDEQELRSYDHDLAKLLDSLHHLAGAVPTTDDSVNPQAWLVNHGNYVQVHGALAAALRARLDWAKELARIDEQVQQMQRAYDSLLTSIPVGQRLKARADYQQARSLAVHQIDALRSEITQNAQDQAATQHARWQAVGAAALTGVVLILGCVLMWLVFDRALRRSWKANARLSDSEARFRSLVENQAEPIAVIDGGGAIDYANPAWKTVFGYELDELQGDNLFELIHADDRLRVRALLVGQALQPDSQVPIPCRLSADYGVWHDVELVCQAHTGANLTAVRVRDVREMPEMPIVPHAEMLHEPAPAEDLTPKLQAAQTRLAELEAECKTLREREAQATEEVRHQRWLLGSHKDAGNEGILILADGKALSWNPAFVQMWKLSDETMAGHSWLTIAAHMETLAQQGWGDFRRACGWQGRQFLGDVARRGQDTRGLCPGAARSSAERRRHALSLPRRHPPARDGDEAERSSRASSPFAETPGRTRGAQENLRIKPARA